MSDTVATCGRPEYRTAAATAALWIGSLFTFSFAHMTATCTAQRSVSFATSAVALGIGSIGAGFMGDKFGRSATAKLLFMFGALSCAAAAAAHPDDVTVVLIFTAAAAASAGGSHVAFELAIESLPEHYRALVLLTYPAIFFPAGAIQTLFDRIGWYNSAVLTACAVLVGGVASTRLPESRLFRLSSSPDNNNNNSLASSTASATAADGSVPPGFSLDDDISGHVALEYSFLGSMQRKICCCRRNGAGGRGSSHAISSRGEGVDGTKDGLCSRLTVLTAALWLLFTVSYYLTSLTFLLPGASGLSGPGHTHMCPPHDEYNSAGTGSAIGWNATAAGKASGPSPVPPPVECSVLPTFVSGAHLIIAEIASVLMVAGLANTKRFGRRLTLVLAFTCATIACTAAAATMPSFGCSGTLARALIEFAVRLSLAAAAQALFLYTAEVCATSVRSTVIGLAVGTFRLGGLLTLANNLSDGADARLQLTAYSLQQGWNGVFGGTGSPIGVGTATAVVLAISAQACLLSSCLSFFLPVEPRVKQLRDVPGQPFLDSAVATTTSAHTSVAAAGTREASGLRRLAAAVASSLRSAAASLPLPLPTTGGAVLPARAPAHVYGRVGSGSMQDQEEEDVELEMAVLHPAASPTIPASGASASSSVGGRTPVAVPVPAVTTHEHRALQKRHVHARSMSRGRTSSAEQHALLSSGTALRARGLSGSVAHVAGTGTGLSPPQQERHGRRMTEQGERKALPPLSPPEGYRDMPVSRAMTVAEEHRDVACADWLIRHLAWAQTEMKQHALVDALDAELHGLDTAGLPLDALPQEIVRWRLLSSMWKRHK